jgi:hypothetical protein
MRSRNEAATVLARLSEADDLIDLATRAPGDFPAASRRDWDAMRASIRAAMTLIRRIPDQTG